MATAERPAIEDKAPAFQEAEVIMRLKPLGDWTTEDVEAHAITVQEAIDEHAAGVALGAAVRCEFDPMAIEVIFTVKATTLAEVQHRIGDVVEAIQPVLPFRLQTESTPAEPAYA